MPWLAIGSIVKHTASWNNSPFWTIITRQIGVASHETLWSEYEMEFSYSNLYVADSLEGAAKQT